MKARKLVAMLLSLVMIVCMTPGMALAETETADKTNGIPKGSYMIDDNNLIYIDDENISLWERELGRRPYEQADYGINTDAINFMRWDAAQNEWVYLEFEEHEEALSNITYVWERVTVTGGSIPMGENSPGISFTTEVSSFVNNGADPTQYNCNLYYGSYDSNNKEKNRIATVDFYMTSGDYTFLSDTLSAILGVQKYTEKYSRIGEEYGYGLSTYYPVESYAGDMWWPIDPSTYDGVVSYGWFKWNEEKGVYDEEPIAKSDALSFDKLEEGDFGRYQYQVTLNVDGKIVTATPEVLDLGIIPSVVTDDGYRIEIFNPSKNLHFMPGETKHVTAYDPDILRVINTHGSENEAYWTELNVTDKKKMGTLLDRFSFCWKIDKEAVSGDAAQSSEFDVSYDDVFGAESFKNIRCEISFDGKTVGEVVYHADRGLDCSLTIDGPESAVYGEEVTLTADLKCNIDTSDWDIGYQWATDVYNEEEGCWEPDTDIEGAGDPLLKVKAERSQLYKCVVDFPEYGNQVAAYFYLNVKSKDEPKYAENELVFDGETWTNYLGESYDLAAGLDYIGDRGILTIESSPEIAFSDIRAFGSETVKINELRLAAAPTEVECEIPSKLKADSIKLMYDPAGTEELRYVYSGRNGENDRLSTLFCWGGNITINGDVYNLELGDNRTRVSHHGDIVINGNVIASEWFRTVSETGDLMDEGYDEALMRLSIEKCNELDPCCFNGNLTVVGNLNYMTIAEPVYDVAAHDLYFVVKERVESYNNDNPGLKLISDGVLASLSEEILTLVPTEEWYDEYEHRHEHDSCALKITPATDKTDGVMEYKCSVCGELQSTTVIPRIASVKLTKTGFTYTGKAVVPAVKVIDANGTVIPAKDKTGTVNYTVTGAKAVGKATAKITFKGKYSGSKSLEFTIYPKKAVVKSVTVGRNRITVRMGSKVAATGGGRYQIQYRVKGTSKWKNAYTTNVSRTIKYLKKGKRYQVRVRAIRRPGTITYCGAWSVIKTTVKVK